MQNLTSDANDLESEDTIYFDKSDKLLFKPALNDTDSGVEQLDVEVQDSSISFSPQSSAFHEQPTNLFK